MGVPAFFRWLSRKYPSIIVNANEERRKGADGNYVPVDITKPNPNFQEFDNLYLDMNGIIHPCTHPEHCAPPSTEDEMFVLIFEYIDRLMAIVRPRKVLYMAVDGVAPRAKMNQQRSRRFRAAKEAQEQRQEIEGVRSKLEAMGIPVPPKKAESQHFDSNCITPGTPFMDRLAVALRYYIHHRLSTDPGWAGLQVILSDASVPGEGEHKIMDYIRRQRASPSHNPNTVHCLCGADADLIMLGLATHEVNFNIIREEFVPNQPRPCSLCGQYGHELKDCRGTVVEDRGSDYCEPPQRDTHFIFLRLPVLREYLERELVMPNLPFAFDFERAVDDWVFMCFFVGNDFLPHLPSLEIREGAIDRLIRLYKEMCYTMKGYLTRNGNVHMDRVEMMMRQLGKVEDDIFKKRQQDEVRYRERQKQQRLDDGGGGGGGGRRRPQRPSFVPGEGSLIQPTASPMVLSGEHTRQLARDGRLEAMQHSANDEAARRLKAMLKIGDGSPAEGAQSSTPNRLPSLLDAGPASTPVDANSRKRKNESPLTLTPSQDGTDTDEPHDEVRLWEAGWKQRYYRSKFDVDADDVEFRHTVANEYVQGLCWVLKYYYQGCASWDWFFPYHYAPFASDMECIGRLKIAFPTDTKPFRPFEQLMSVLPPASKMHIPRPLQKLMIDPKSPIIDFYPEDFKIDLNGKKFAWQGVALLPFVDQQRLLDVVRQCDGELNSEETHRNTRGSDRLFVAGKPKPASARHALADFLAQLYESEAFDEVMLDPTLTYGMAGSVKPLPDVPKPGESFRSPMRETSCGDFVTGAYETLFADPHFAATYEFAATRLPNAVEPERTLKPGDWNDRRQGNFRPQIGFSREQGGQRGQVSDAGHRMLGHAVVAAGGPPIQHDPNRRGRNGQSGYQQAPNDAHYATPQPLVFQNTNFAAPHAYGRPQQNAYNAPAPLMGGPHHGGYNQSWGNAGVGHHQQPQQQQQHRYQQNYQYQQLQQPPPHSYRQQQQQQQQQQYPPAGYDAHFSARPLQPPPPPQHQNNRRHHQ